jgi:hypothetical protein
MRSSVPYSTLTLIGLAACAGGAVHERSPPTETTHATVVGSPMERNAKCESCHPTIAREWRASLHQQSATDPVYARAFAREPLPFCSGCHDPHADSSLGTACVSCHDTKTASMRARPCADCHEFPFPDGTGKMQLTATEHAASVHASRSCVNCHMPVTNGHASHRFPASRDPTMLRRAASITSSRSSDGVRITFSVRDVGHALPTGDIFRRLQIEVAVPGEDGSRRRVFLGRKTKLGEAHDDRPFVDGAQHAEVRVPIVAPGKPLVWRVLYERVEHPTSVDESEAEIEGCIELAAGTL